MRILPKLLAILLVSGAVSGCISFTTAQTGRTLKDGEVAGHAGLMYLDQTTKDKDKSSAGTTSASTDAEKSYGFVVGARYGLNGRVDLGARGSSEGVTMFDGKFQLVAKRTFAAAVGFGLGLANWNFQSKTKSERSDTETISKANHRIVDVPIYLSIDSSADLSLYSAPRYVYVHSQTTSGLGLGSSDDEQTSSARLIGLTAGILMHSKPGFFGEFSYYTSPDKNVESMSGLQFAAGLAFNQP